MEENVLEILDSGMLRIFGPKKYSTKLRKTA